MDAKKLIRAAAFVVVAAVGTGHAVAEIHPSKRYVELGIDLGVGAMQNMFTLGDIMKEELVIDFTKIAKDLPASGFAVAMQASPQVSMSFNFKKFGFGVYAKGSANANVGISRELFDVLGKGLSQGEEVVTSVNANVETYVEVGVPVRIALGKKLTVRATPALYTPLVYVPQPDVSIVVKNDYDGTTTATLNADFAMYSAVDMSGAVTDEGGLGNVGGVLSDALGAGIPSLLFSNAGFDLAVGAEYALSSKLDVGAYANIPIKPAILKNKTYGHAEFEAKLNPILDSLTKGGEVEFEMTDTDKIFSGIQTESTSYSVNRPFRLGAEAAWRPFGGKKWFVVSGMLGVAATNPFGEDFDWHRSLYPEYSVSLDLTALYVFGFNVTSDYRDHVFTQSAGIRLNMRVLELDVTVGSSSTSFKKSWAVAGVKGQVGVKMGF